MLERDSGRTGNRVVAVSNDGDDDVRQPAASGTRGSRLPTDGTANRGPGQNSRSSFARQNDRLFSRSARQDQVSPSALQENGTVKQSREVYWPAHGSAGRSAAWRD